MSNIPEIEDSESNDQFPAYIELNTEAFAEIEKNYADSNSIPFSELLHTHHKQIVWGFRFGEEVMKRAQENMRLARDKNVQEKRKIEDVSQSPTRPPSETDIDTEKPCCSKFITEEDHKTPHSRKRQRLRRRHKRIRTTDCSTDVSPRKTPLPLLNWADSKEVWSYMVYKEEASLTMRNPRLFEDFSNLLPRMRAILLDWIMEVCEVYHLRRVTYYLSVDYFDRFLSIRPDVPKNQLQLVGVTCLFLAAKLEEIYPPKLTELSYVCDGACTPEEILACELLILNSLGWDLNLMTPSDWLNLYMQIHFKADTVTKQRLHSDINKDFLYPQFSGYQFTRASQMIDLCSLDPGFLKFSYSTIAAAAMYFMYGKRAALSVSGLTWEQLKDCAEYMAVFYQVIRNSSDPKLQCCTSDPNAECAQRSLDSVRPRVRNLVSDENHSFQTHVINMEYFEKAAVTRLEQMGLRVHRILCQKESTDEKETAENTTTENYSVLYEVERVYDSDHFEDPENTKLQSLERHIDLILSPDNNTCQRMTLDDMLTDIVKYNSKNLPSPIPRLQARTVVEECEDETYNQLTDAAEEDTAEENTKDN